MPEKPRFSFKNLVRKPAGRGLALFLLLFSVCMAYVFYPVWPLSLVTVSPDALKIYPVYQSMRSIDELLAGTQFFLPVQFVSLLFPPLAWQEMQYILPCLFGALGLFYYLRTQGLSRLASYAAGLFFAFSGYSFTLINAGHLGYFNIILYFMFAFGLMDRCMVRRDLFYFVALGAVVMWGEIQQPDIWMLFFALLVAFGLWKSLLLWKTSKSWSFLWKVYPRFLLTAATMLLIGWGAIHQALTETLAGRDAQIAQSDGAGKSADSSSPENEAKEKSKRWIFTTNWSLPPEDLLETIVPGIFGDESMRPQYPLAGAQHPYWGRLGRPHESQFIKGRMMPNYRQHTIYLGLITVLLAAFGAVTFFRRRKTVSQEETGCLPSDVPFWIGAVLVTAVLAMGRYTPLYRVAYSLPFMNYLRAPVKFFHLLEVSVACLAGFGVQAFLDDAAKTGTARRRWSWICAGTAAVLLVGILFAMLCSDSLVRTIHELGLSGMGNTLSAYLRNNLLRAFFLAMTTFGLFFFSARKGANRKRAVLCMCVLVVAGVCDLAGVCRRYIVPVSVCLQNSPNALTAAMARITGGAPAHVADYVSPGIQGANWLPASLWSQGFENVLPHDAQSHYLSLYQQTKENPVLFWQRMGIRFVLLPRKDATELQRRGVLRPILDFTLTGDVLRTCPPQENSLTLSEFSGPYEFSLLSARTSRPFSLVTRGESVLENEGMVMMMERFSPSLCARVDGKPVAVESANGLWAAVRVPAGKHTVEIHRKMRAPFFLGFSVLLLLMVWGGLRTVKSLRTM